MNFYALIIGTEILNGRREDQHFAFVQRELAKYGHELFASFIIKDDEKLMKKAFEMIKEDENAIMFSFGGIGSTPDDLTRDIASEVFTNSKVVAHKQFLQDIIERFADDSYPHRINMANLPPNSDLLFNPVNNMSGFSLMDKYYFVPGFPSMAHPMISQVIKKSFSKAKKKFRLTLLAITSEDSLIPLMQVLPSSIELSSLPMFVDLKANVELSISGEDEDQVKYFFSTFTKKLDEENVVYELI